jgi:hypothetical protein
MRLSTPPSENFAEQSVDLPDQHHAFTATIVPWNEKPRHAAPHAHLNLWLLMAETRSYFGLEDAMQPPASVAIPKIGC